MKKLGFFIGGLLVGSILTAMIMRMGTLYALSQMIFHPFNPNVYFLMVTPHEVMGACFLSVIVLLLDLKRILKEDRDKIRRWFNWFEELKWWK